MKGKKYFFKYPFKKFQNDFSNCETPKKKISKNSKTPRKKNVFKFCKTIFSFQSSKRFLHVFQPFSVWKWTKYCFHQNFVSKSYRFQSSNDFYSNFSRFQYKNEKKIIFTKIFHCFQMFQNDFFRFPAVFSMKTKTFLFSPKLFSKSSRFQMFQKDFFKTPNQK